MRRALTTTLMILPGFLACEPAALPVVEWDPSWEVQYSDSTIYFWAVSIVDPSTVWVAGAGGRVAHSNDGGESWTVSSVPGAEGLQFRDVEAFSGQEAFVLSIGNGPDSRIYRTSDGGVSWELSFQNEDPNGFFDCFSFWDKDTGMAFSDSYEGEFTLMRTLDGGVSWQRIDPSLVPDARPGEGAFAASGTCLVTRPGGLAWFGTGASGVDTRVIRTADFGDSWSEAPTPILSTDGASGVFSLSFLDDETGMAVGGKYNQPDSVYQDAAVTFDGGMSWTLVAQTNLGGAASGVSYLPEAPTPSLVAVSASGGTAFSLDNGQSWTVFDTPSYQAVAFVGPGTGWAVGRGRISRIR
ncbi:MAG: hypothetical protein MUO50_08705 [Longimicrobiales bacterium]|nr:hypothetical protein [Longimicrobiales bacterium]